MLCGVLFFRLLACLLAWYFGAVRMAFRCTTHIPFELDNLLSQLVCMVCWLRIAVAEWRMWKMSVRVEDVRVALVDCSPCARADLGEISEEGATNAIWFAHTEADTHHTHVSTQNARHNFTNGWMMKNGLICGCFTYKLAKVQVLFEGALFSG